MFYTSAGGIAAALGAHAFFTGCVLAANGAVALAGPLAAGGPVGVWLFHRRFGRRYGGMAAAGAPALLTASVGSVVGSGSVSSASSSSTVTLPPLLQKEQRTFSAPTPPEALRNIWTPSALRKNARGWHPGDGSVWQGWRAPSFFPRA